MNVMNLYTLNYSKLYAGINKPKSNALILIILERDERFVWEHPSMTSRFRRREGVLEIRTLLVKGYKIEFGQGVGRGSKKCDFILDTLNKALLKTI